MYTLDLLTEQLADPNTNVADIRASIEQRIAELQFQEGQLRYERRAFADRLRRLVTLAWEARNQTLAAAKPKVRDGVRAKLVALKRGESVLFTQYTCRAQIATPLHIASRQPTKEFKVEATQRGLLVTRIAGGEMPPMDISDLLGPM